MLIQEGVGEARNNDRAIVLRRATNTKPKQRTSLRESRDGKRGESEDGSSRNLQNVGACYLHVMSYQILDNSIL
jgi:hypothetical protein